MESAKLRRWTFRALAAQVAASLLLHWPPMPGLLCGQARWAWGLATLALAITAAYIHSLYPERHDEPGDFPRLLTEGPYRYVRHPFYTCFIGMSFTVALWACSVPGLAFAAAMLPLWNALAAKEEEELLRHWGDEYRRFMESRGRFLPRLRSPKRGR